VEYEAAFPKRDLVKGASVNVSIIGASFDTLFQPIVENSIGQDAILRIVNAQMRLRRCGYLPFTGGGLVMARRRRDRRGPIS
jgi:hypothetical protein